MEALLHEIVSNDLLHSRWLATLSYLELCGARKIANFLPKYDSSSDLLQHAAEEFRHAYFFKRQIAKLSDPNDLLIPTLLCRKRGNRYLQILDLNIARWLRTVGYHESLANACYLLTTYAIEKRAQVLYGLYDKILQGHGSPISLRSILREEEHHLHSIEKQMLGNELLQLGQKKACEFEQVIFTQFWSEISRSVVKFDRKQSHNLLANALPC